MTDPYEPSPELVEAAHDDIDRLIECTNPIEFGWRFLIGALRRAEDCDE